MLRLVLAMILCVQFSMAQTRFQIIDRQTSEPVAYASVAYNGSGKFANVNGAVQIDEPVNGEIRISCLGYGAISINPADIKNEKVYMDASAENLLPVTVRKPLGNRKSRMESVAAQKHNDFIHGHMLIIGGEVAYLLKPKMGIPGQRVSSLTIPVITKTIDMSEAMVNKKQLVKNLPFAGLYRLSFYQNDNNLPGAAIELVNDILVVLDHKSKTFDINVEKHRIDLPEEGVFVGITNLGPLDEEGRFIPTEPFMLRELNGATVKVAKPTKPYLPVHYNSKEFRTYYRFAFDGARDWGVFYKDMRKDNRIHNISIGFEYKVYETEGD